MTSGTPVARGLVFILQTGEIVVDWGEGRVQDILTGDFLEFEESDYGGAVTDSDLERLKDLGRVVSYTIHLVYLRPLPEPPRPTIE
jgi:hypothetical protein